MPQVAVYETREVFQVVSFGVGTKFMPHKAILNDQAGVCVRDCHAEVLARRAFIRFLHLQLQSARSEHPSCSLVGSTGAGPAGGSVGRGECVQATAEVTQDAAASLQVLP